MTVDKFIVAGERGLKALPHVIGKRSVNVYSHGGTAARQAVFTLGWDSKPDSDWGRYKGASLRVISTRPELHRPTENAIRKALGWKPLEGDTDDAA